MADSKIVPAIHLKEGDSVNCSIGAGEVAWKGPTFFNTSEYGPQFFEIVLWTRGEPELRGTLQAFEDVEIYT